MLRFPEFDVYKGFTMRVKPFHPQCTLHIWPKSSEGESDSVGEAVLEIWDISANVSSYDIRCLMIDSSMHTFGCIWNDPQDDILPIAATKTK